MKLSVWHELYVSEHSSTETPIAIPFIQCVTTVQHIELGSGIDLGAIQKVEWQDTQAHHKYYALPQVPPVHLAPFKKFAVSVIVVVNECHITFFSISCIKFWLSLLCSFSQKYLWERLESSLLHPQLQVNQQNRLDSLTLVGNQSK